MGPCAHPAIRECYIAQPLRKEFQRPRVCVQVSLDLPIVAIVLQPSLRLESHARRSLDHVLMAGMLISAPSMAGMKRPGLSARCRHRIRTRGGLLGACGRFLGCWCHVAPHCLLPVRSVAQQCDGEGCQSIGSSTRAGAGSSTKSVAPPSSRFVLFCVRRLPSWLKPVGYGVPEVSTSKALQLALHARRGGVALCDVCRGGCSGSEASVDTSLDAPHCYSRSDPACSGGCSERARAHDRRASGVRSPERRSSSVRAALEKTHSQSAFGRVGCRAPPPRRRFGQRCAGCVPSRTP